MGRSVFIQRIVFCLASTFLIGTASISVQAQDAQPVGVQVRMMSVKPDSVAQFEAAIGDISAALQEQGRPFFHVYERLRGDGVPGYSVFTQDPYFGEVVPVDIGDALGDRIRHTLSDSTRLTIQTYTNLGIAGESLAPPAPYLRTRVRITSPANRADFIEWQEEAVELLTEAGLSDLRVGRIVLGGNSDSWVRWTYQESISGPPTGLDIEGTVGQNRIDAMVAEGNELLVAQEDYVLMFREDLSFTAE
jgi:hypothetical protein